MPRADVMISHMSGADEHQQSQDAVTARARMHKGDLEALAVVLDEYQGRLLRYLVRLVKEQAIAEDLFQLTWLRVMEKIRSYDSARDFGPCLFAIARFLSSDPRLCYQPES